MRTPQRVTTLRTTDPRHPPLAPFATCRERKTVDYNGNGMGMPKKDEVKFPRHLKLPRMDDWQLYKKFRLEEISEQEHVVFQDGVDR